MTHAAKILADSLSPDGVRLTTMEVVMPRIVLAEFNTHRLLSRNSASSRAIPVEKMIKMVMGHPYIPTHWGKNQKGMQAEEEVTGDALVNARHRWLEACEKAIVAANRLLDVGIHKQITNRLLEPFMWHTVIVTATAWSNFFNLRCHPMAHPEIKKTAELMRDAMAESTPEKLLHGAWHVPLIRDEDVREVAVLDGDSATLGGDDSPASGWHRRRWQQLCKISVGRCARVSYLTHDGKRDIGKDIELHDELLKNGHMSPFEHVARPMTPSDLARRGGLEPLAETFSGNFRGWVQYRKTIPNEADILGGR